MKFGAVTALGSGLLCAFAIGAPARDSFEAAHVQRAEAADLSTELKAHSEQLAISEELRRRAMSAVTLGSVAEAQEASPADEAREVAAEHAAAEADAQLARLQEERDALEMQQEAFVEEIRRLKEQLESSLQTQADYKSRAAELELQAVRSAEQVSSKDDEEQAIRSMLEKQSEELESLRRQLGDSTTAVQECQQRAEEKDRLLARLPEVRDKFDAIRGELNEREQELKVCKSDLAGKEEVVAKLPELSEQFDATKTSLTERDQELKLCREELSMKEAVVAGIPAIKKELIAAKNDLLLRETEIKMLQAGADKEALKAIAKMKREQRAVAAQSRQAPQPPQIAKLTAEEQPEQQVATAPAPQAGTGEVVVLEVTADKANLRSGPGVEHSPLMQVQLGTRLTVEARQGDWFRVYTPTGTRAYVREDVVAEAGEESKPQPVAVEQQLAVARAKMKAPAQPAAQTGDEALVPFGEVNLSSQPNKDLENRALDILREGIRKRK